MRQIKYIVVHTAAANIPNVDVEVIRQWHIQRGFSDIGYHYVIINDKHEKYEDGTVQEGRPLAQIGAHTLGINESSIGICCAGHGDITSFTEKQLASLKKLVKDLQDQFRVPVENVIGHREVNKLVDQKIISEQYRTGKTCPGTKIDMDELRKFISSEEHAFDRDGFISAINTINKDVKEVAPNSFDEWLHFINHPEILHLKGE